MKPTMAAHAHPSHPDRQVADLVSAAQREGHPDCYAGKRDHTRYMTGMRLEIACDPTNSGETAPVVMHNVSEGGFAFWFRRSLEPRTVIYLRDGEGSGTGEWLPAVVRHCTRGILGYLVGAQFEREAGESAECAATGVAGVPAVKTVDSSKAEHLRRLVRKQLGKRR